MKIETIAVTNVPTNSGVVALKKSLIKYGIPNTIIVTPWEGFYTKVNEAYKYCQQTDADFILFLDAHDVLVVGGLDEIIERVEDFGRPDMLFSTEKAIWPVREVWTDPSLADKYEEVDSPWKYLNSGTYLIRPELLVELVKPEELYISMDDQMYWAGVYLKNKTSQSWDETTPPSDRLELDYNCNLFQTLAHDDGSSFSIIDGKFTNLITQSNPLIIHGNGQSDMSKYYNL